MATTYLLHPIVVFLVSNVTLTFTAAFTDRGSPVRYIALAILAICAYVLPRSYQHFVKSTGWIGRVPAGAAFWNNVTCIDRLILRGWDYEHYGPHDLHSSGNGKAKSSPDRSDQIRGTRMEFGSEVAGLARGVDRFWEIKNVPHFDEERPDYVPSRGAFVLVHTAAVLTCYYLHNFAASATFRLDPQLLDASHIPLLARISELTTRELRTRVISTLGYWTVQYCMMQFFYSASALVSAMINPQSIKSWRPLFGSPKDAYTLRNFWG